MVARFLDGLQAASSMFSSGSDRIPVSCLPRRTWRTYEVFSDGTSSPPRASELLIFLLDDTVDGNQKSGGASTSWGKGSWNPMNYRVLYTIPSGLEIAGFLVAINSTKPGIFRECFCLRLIVGHQAGPAIRPKKKAANFIGIKCYPPWS